MTGGLRPPRLAEIAPGVQMGPLTETVLLGNISLRPELREKMSYQSLNFDPETLSFPNMPEADQFLHYEYRSGWKL